jgi:iron complex transport system ATP-binding protein
VSADAVMIALREVEFAYARAGLRIQTFSLSVARGEMLAIVGPNGSGKTTLLRLMAGLLRPARGSIAVCGLDPATGDRRALARRVAMLGPQAPLGFPYTAIEVVLMGRAPHVEGFRLETEHDLDAATAARRATGVLDLAERQFDTLSSGERQRVAVARALAQEPELLLLDEPAVYLDIKQQTALYDLLEDLNGRTGLTVVSVLHDLNLASLYFRRVAMLKAGELHAVGSPAEVITYRSIRDVFDTDVYVDLNSITGSLNVSPLPRRRNQ